MNTDMHVPVSMTPRAVSDPLFHTEGFLEPRTWLTNIISGAREWQDLTAGEQEKLKNFVIGNVLGVGALEKYRKDPRGLLDDSLIQSLEKEIRDKGGSLFAAYVGYRIRDVEAHGRYPGSESRVSIETVCEMMKADSGMKLRAIASVAQVIADQEELRQLGALVHKA